MSLAIWEYFWDRTKWVQPSPPPLPPAPPAAPDYIPAGGRDYQLDGWTGKGWNEPW